MTFFKQSFYCWRSCVFQKNPCNVFVTVDKHCGGSSAKAKRMDLSHMKCILPTPMLLNLTFEGTFQSGGLRTNVVFSRAPGSLWGTPSVKKKLHSSCIIYTFQPIALLCESRAELTSWAYDKGQGFICCSFHWWLPRADNWFRWPWFDRGVVLVDLPRSLLTWIILHLYAAVVLVIWFQRLRSRWPCRDPAQPLSSAACRRAARAGELHTTQTKRSVLLKQFPMPK